MIAIDKGVPLLRDGRGLSTKYPFLAMEVGDSFFVVEEQRIIGSSVYRFCKTYPGRKFATRKVDGGTRCWRVE